MFQLSVCGSIQVLTRFCHLCATDSECASPPSLPPDLLPKPYQPYVLVKYSLTTRLSTLCSVLGVLFVV